MAAEQLFGGDPEIAKVLATETGPLDPEEFDLLPEMEYRGQVERFNGVEVASLHIRDADGGTRSFSFQL